MRRLELCLLVSGVLAFSACGGSDNPSKDGGAGKGGHGGGGSGGAGTGGGGNGGAGTGGSGGGGTGGTAGMDAGVDVTPTTDAPVGDVASDLASDLASGETHDGPTDGVPLSAAAMRGQYLVGVLGCAGCHTANLAGKATFATDTATNGALASANLTPDATGIKNLTDQQVIDAFTKGIYPGATDAGTQYLFANMPYYQFATLTTADATDIVAYLRSVAPVSLMAVDTGLFATRPTAAQWTLNTLAGLPNAATPDGGVDGGADAAVASTSNGKYLASLVCATCHTVNTAATTPPFALDETKGYQGRKIVNITQTVPVDGGADGGDAGDAGDAATTTMVTESIESANLTPDVTGLAGWTAPQISTAITTAKDKLSRQICGMRANSMTALDATDIANYLQAIPAVANTPTPTCY